MRLPPSSSPRRLRWCPRWPGCCWRPSPTCWAFYAFPAADRSKLRSTNPLERVNREIGRRTDVVGVFPNDQALLRLAGSLLIEQNDEWLVSRRSLSEASMAELTQSSSTTGKELQVA